jgi:hypothetical protein
VTNPFNNNEIDALISKIYFGMRVRVFRTVPLSINPDPAAAAAAAARKLSTTCMTLLCVQ